MTVSPEQNGLAALGAMLAAVVEDTLKPALDNRRVQSCLHVLDALYTQLPPGEKIAASDDWMVFVCPQHPERLLCSAGPSASGEWSGCVTSHVVHYHANEPLTGACFACSTPEPEPGDFVPVTAKVELHRPIPFYDDNRSRDAWFTYSGTIWTLPTLAFLCPEHADLVKLPLRMTWPTDATDVRPEDVYRL